MATFPSLEPIDRSYGLGAHLLSAVSGQNGDTTTFAHSALAADVPIDLAFPDLTLAQVQLIRNHYSGQRGTVLPFEIPAELWRTHASLHDVVLSGMSYRYGGPISETPKPGGLYDVAVSLISHY
jgi:hypothetical protein